MWIPDSPENLVQLILARVWTQFSDFMGFTALRLFFITDEEKVKINLPRTINFQLWYYTVFVLLVGWLFEFMAYQPVQVI